MIEVARERLGKRRGPGADPLPNPSRVLLDDRGCAYRVLESKPIAEPEGHRRLLLLVQVLGLRARELAALHGLTPRQAHIAVLLARRATNAEIAAELDISQHTARHHTEHVLAKLGVRSRAAVRPLLFEGPGSVDRV